MTFRLRDLLRKYRDGELDSLTALLVQNKLKMDSYDKVIRRKIRRRLAEKGVDVEFLEERERVEDLIEQLEEERQSKLDRLLLGGRGRKKKRRRRR